MELLAALRRLLLLAFVAVAGLVLLAFGLGTCTGHGGRDHELRLARDSAAQWQARAVAAARRADSAAAVAAARARQADSIERAAEALTRAREQLRHQIALVAPDRVLLAGDTIPTIVPMPVVSILATDDRLVDSLWHVVAAKDVTIGAQRRAIAQQDTARAVADSVGAHWQRVADVEASRHQRCGRRCGVVIGVVGTVAVAVGATAARQLVRLLWRAAIPP